ncbi:MAG: hypothetical protein QOG31_535 [Thermoplasmata archaeon]|nr:hypothetical protein [Thermoplasmata archaeon]
MLCVNCDHALPDGASACPGCGARPLELLVTPATEATLAPRRRRKGWGIVALLLCAAVVVALAGQASQSHSGSAASAAPHPKAKGPAKSTSTPTSAATTPSAPEPDVVRVALGDVPENAPDPAGALAAARGAMRDWGNEGLDLREARGRSADVEVQFVLDAADATGSGSGLAVVPLGDSACGGSWSAYTTESIQALAARALGQAMGKDGPAGPGEPMDPLFKPSHAGDCDGAHGSLAIPRGQSDGKGFRLGNAATVAYSMQVQDGYADVCLLTPGQWDAFVAGEGGGAACSYSVQSYSDRSPLEAGRYILGFRCVEASPTCHVDYTLSAQPA